MSSKTTVHGTYNFFFIIKSFGQMWRAQFSIGQTLCATIRTRSRPGTTPPSSTRRSSIEKSCYADSDSDIRINKNNYTKYSWFDFSFSCKGFKLQLKFYVCVSWKHFFSAEFYFYSIVLSVAFEILSYWTIQIARSNDKQLNNETCLFSPLPAKLYMPSNSRDININLWTLFYSTLHFHLTLCCIW